MPFLKWTRGNEKLNKLGTYGFGLPAGFSADGFLVCKNQGVCASWCYAKAGNYTFPAVKAAREHNLAIVRNSVPDFLAKAMSDIRNFKNCKTLRIHDSGDFINLEYLQAWFKIARAFPAIKFYAYSKRIDLPLYVNKPKNMNIVQSVGGTMDDKINPAKPHARVFSTDYARRQAGYGNGSKTDTLALNGTVKVGLIYHNQKHLTPAQKKYIDSDERNPD